MGLSQNSHVRYDSPPPLTDATQKVHAQLFYELHLETHTPVYRLLRGIDRFLVPHGLREEMHNFYSHTRRPSIDP
jgi:hypothetical protein